MAGMLIRILSLLMLLSLTACGDDRPEQIAQLQQLNDQRLEKLGQMLDKDQLRNGILLKQYGQILAQQRPELQPLVEQLTLDATSKGPLYKSLESRVKDAKVASNFVNLDQQLEEENNLYQALDSSLFNDMLSDPVNVIADMSEGKLARVNAISREASTLANGSEDFGAGSQLVGNPAYGQWQTDSNGMSFWAWYGMYSMFSNLFHRPVYYDNWSRGRDYSYYNDVGRYRYTSPKQAKAQTQVYERTKKRFDSQGKRFDSPYAKSRSGSSALSRQSSAAPKPSSSGQSANKFRSNYSKDSSFRNSGSRTSRGVSRGK
ncbi:hypothetical protein ACFFLG_02140 [Shewanella indica]|uniref:hypothetical protein n=1 Tax=Shewanella indica TaxID=768528 RepID=UPI000C34D050|nr:hypothetical protein [Shewanella indica]GHB00758.1 hypothetical protein GCM10007107_12030 [Shewanella indica]